jgi:imidazolonepropionase-like amidohydrolase
MNSPGLRRVSIACFVLLLAGGASPLTQTGGTADLVVRGGSLIAMVSETPEIVALKGIVVRGGRIDRIVLRNQAEPLPPAAQAIDATSQFIMPGLIDSHVHFRTWFPELCLEYGVTTIMDTGPSGAAPNEDANEFIARWKRELGDGTRRGPSLYITGKKLNGPEGAPEPNMWLTSSVPDLVSKVETLAGFGVDALKAEAGLPLEFRKRLVEEGERRGLPVVGHSKDARESISVGMRFIEHMYPIAMSLSGDAATQERGNEYLMDLAQAPALIDLMLAKRVYLNPTLAGGFGWVGDRRGAWSEEDARLLRTPPFASIPQTERALILKRASRLDDLPPEKQRTLHESYRKVQTFVKQFSGKGGQVLVGSDMGDDDMPGLLTHRELQLLVDAGITPYRALLGATRFNAEMMRKQALIGTVEPGKQADLLVLGGNPVEDIGASRRVQYVISKGRIARRPDQSVSP